MEGKLKIEIDRHVPIVPSAGKKGRNALYPWAKMERGDSFLVPCTYRKKHMQSTLSNCGRSFARYNGNGHKFVTRQVDDGIRVWRIA